jgi:hypothetical protein
MVLVENLPKPDTMRYIRIIESLPE